MKRYFLYLIIYSVLGFILERLINIIAYKEYVDNSILIGPYQPLYGSGIVMALIIYDQIIRKKVSNKVFQNITLVITAIIATGIAEAVTGYGYEYFFKDILWDYGEFLPCKLQYICWIPTTSFGILSYFVIKYIHPFIESYERVIPKLLKGLIFTVFIVDIIITLILLNN